MNATHETMAKRFNSEPTLDASVGATRRWTFRLALIVMSAVLLIPSVIWASRDVSVWSWDPAYYALNTLWDVISFRDGPISWHYRLMSPSATPPLLVWTGQLFAPLSALIGRYEPALLLTNIFFGLLALIFVGSAARRLTNSAAAAVTAILICAGSSIFLAMTNNYFAESPQMMAIALLVRVTIEAGYEPWRVFLTKFLFACIIAMGAKFSAFIIIMPLAAYAAAALFINRKLPSQPVSRNGLILTTIVCTPISIALIIWYIYNFHMVIEHARRFSTSSAAYFYGKDTGFLAKLSYWWNNLLFSTTPIPYFGWILFVFCLLVIIFIAITQIKLISRDNKNLSAVLKNMISNGYLFALCLTGTIAFLLAIYSFQINEDARFIAPIIPVVAVLIAWSIAAVRSPVFAAAAIALFIVNYGATQATNLGFSRVGTPIHYLHHPGMNTASFERLQQAVQETCTSVHPTSGIVVGVGIRDFNANTINFEAAKQQITRGFPCIYGTYDTYDTDLAKAIDFIRKLNSDVVLTLPVKDLPGPDNMFFFANRPALDFAKWLASSSEFKLTSSPDAPIVVYQRVAK